MKRVFCIVALGLPVLVLAGQLEDANGLMNAKAYDKAFPIYAKLAEAGNPDAQFRLGEMYWYGEGTAPDDKMATTWVQKSAATGHKGATELLAILKERETRRADIIYWTSSYKGEDLVSGTFNCPAPAIPAVSTTTLEIKATYSAYTNWQTCYNGFAANLNSVTSKQRIPADLARLMTPREGDQALAHLNMVYSSVIDKVGQDATAIGANYAKWEAATQKHVAEDNKTRRMEYDIATNAYDQRRQQVIQNSQTVRAPATVPSR